MRGAGLIASLISMALAATVVAQSPPEANSQTRCVAIVDALLHGPDGPRRGTLLMSKRALDDEATVGRIEAVGDVEVPPMCVRIAGRGLEVTPGLIESASHLGLVEVSMAKSTWDHRSESDDQVRAAFRAVDGYDPSSSLIPIARTHGLTTAIVRPSSGMIAGISMAADLSGERQADAVVRSEVAAHASVDGPIAEFIVRLRDLLDLGAAFAAKGDRVWETRRVPRDVGAADLEVLSRVARGELPIVLPVDRAPDIEALLRFQAEAGLRMILVGGAEAWRHAAALAAADVAVIIDPLVDGAGSFDQLQGRADNAAVLVAAGVDVALSSFSSHNARRLRQAAGNAVRGGLTHEAAIAAVTAVPARIFGLDGRGRLEVGAVANVAVWDGDPLDLSTNLVRLYIDGEKMSEANRQRALLERYRDLPGSPTPALELR